MSARVEVDRGRLVRLAEAYRLRCFRTRNVIRDWGEQRNRPQEALTRCPGALLQGVFEPDVSEDLPDAWPDADPGTHLGELVVRLVYVDFYVGAVLLQDQREEESA